MHLTKTFNPPARCIVSIRGNSQGGTVRIVGYDDAEKTIEDQTQKIPAAPMHPVVGHYCEIYSIHLFSKVDVYMTGLEEATVVISGDVPQTYTFPAPVSCLSEQERAEIRRIAREAAQEVIREMVSELKRKGPPVL
jgi:hypothetical protein